MSRADRRLLVIDGIGGVRPSDTVRRVRGVELVVVGARGHSGFAASPPPGSFRLYEAGSLSELVPEAVAIGRSLRVDGVIAYSELMLSAAAEVAAALFVPHNTPAVTGRLRDKGLQREALQAAGAPCPRHLVVGAEPVGKEEIEWVGLPAVLKPSFGVSSACLQLIRSRRRARGCASSHADSRDLTASWDPDRTCALRVSWSGDDGMRRTALVITSASSRSVAMECTTTSPAVTDKTPLEDGFYEDRATLLPAL